MHDTHGVFEELKLVRELLHAQEHFVERLVLDFGLSELRQTAVVEILRNEFDANSGKGSSDTALSLLERCFGSEFELDRLDEKGGVEGSRLLKARVDHVCEVGEGEGRFGDVGGQ